MPRDKDLNRIEHENPCAMTWHGLEGGDRERHCATCDKTVYNLSTRTRGEAIEIIQEPGVCTRFERDAWGSVVTADGPGRWQLGRRLMLRAVAMLGLGRLWLPRAAFSQSVNYDSCQHSSWTVRSGGTHADVLVQGVVRDATNAPIAGAEILLGPLNTAWGDRRVLATTDDKGAFKITTIEPGRLELLVASEGFSNESIAPINVAGGATIDIKVCMHLGSVGGNARLAPAEPPATRRFA